MSEQQYAFAIGFDADATEMTPQQEADWQEMVQHIAQAIAAANLPSVFSERWDEFGHGRVFWGTRTECGVVQQVLSRFPVVLQEERNLDEGYYALGGQKYYVTALGDIYELPVDGALEQPAPPQQLPSIPIDAYRLHNISPEITRYVETIRQAESLTKVENSQLQVMDTVLTAALSSIEETVNADQLELSPPIPSNTVEIPSQKSEPIPDPVVTAFIEDLQSEISSLKEQVATLSNDLAQSRAIAAVKIEPALFETLQQEYTAKQDQFEQLRQQHLDKQDQYIQLEQEVHSLEAQVVALQETTQGTTHLKELETLRAQLYQQQQQTHALEQQLQTIQGTEQLIDPQTYTELQAKLQSQAEEGEALRTKIRTLETELQQQQMELTTSHRLAQERNDTLVQEALVQSTQIAELERTVRQLQGEVQQWKAMAEEKVDFVEYQRVQQELTHLRGRLRQGIRGRLLGWLFL
jgi:predicted  nucleic acid-binding Zn-ribbon protein